MTLHTFKRRLKSYLFHILRVDEQKKHSQPPSAVVAFFCDFGAGYKTPNLLTYLLTYLLACLLMYRLKCYKPFPSLRPTQSSSSLQASFKDRVSMLSTCRAVLYELFRARRSTALLLKAVLSVTLVSYI